MATTVRRHAAVLFSDMQGYSAQMGRDEAAALARLEQHDRLLRACIERHGGRVVKTVGDAFMVDFASEISAVACALDVQRALAEHNATVAEGEDLHVRIGVHAGDVIIREDGDLFGATVNIAARLEPMAATDTVCISAAVYERVLHQVAASAQDLGAQTLKNIPHPVHLYLLRPAAQSLHGAVAASAMASPRRPVRWWRAVALALAAVVAAGVWLAWRRQPTVPPAPVRGGTLRLSFHHDPASYDLFASQASLQRAALRMVVEPLLTPRPNGEFDPGLAERWQVADGGKTVRFVLRPAWFHPHPCLAGGAARTVTAHDARASLQERLRQGKTSVPVQGLAAFRAGQTDTLAGLSVESTSTLAVHLETPLAHPLVGLNAQVFPAELLHCDPPRAWRRPVGTGPFRFDAAPDPERIRLVRHERWWAGDGRLPWLDAVELHTEHDPREALRRIGRGELDTAFFGRGQASSVVAKSATGNWQLQPAFGSLPVSVGVESASGTVSVLTVQFLARVDRPAVHPALRQALARAIDRQQLAQPAEGLVPGHRLLQPRQLGHDPALRVPELDLTAAREWLAKVPTPLPEFRLGADVRLLPVAQSVQKQWQALGVPVKVVEVAQGSAAKVLAEQSLDGLVVTVTHRTTGVEPHPYLSSLAQLALRDLHPEPSLQATVDALAVEQDRDQRAVLYGRLEQQLLADCAVVPLGFVPAEGVLVFTSQRVRDAFDDGRVAEHGGPAVAWWWLDRAPGP